MLDILHRDDHLVAVNKPSGLLVHRSFIDPAAHEFALQLTRDQIGQRVYPVHRLDRPTSGVLLFALSPEIASRLSAQFAGRQIRKTYLALVRGHLPDSGRIDHPLKEELDSLSDRLALRDKAAQDAVTEYSTLARCELPYPVGRYASARYSLASLHPLTGRKHQLRRHMKHVFHPIVGDTSHGDGKQNAFVRQQYDCRRLMLHASSLQLPHPVSSENLHVFAPMPTDMHGILTDMGLAQGSHHPTSAKCPTHDSNSDSNSNSNSNSNSKADQ